MLDFTEKVAVITGASSGIGAALALEFSRLGAKLTLFARREDRLAQVAESCPGPVEVVTGDVTKESARQSLVQATMDRWGRLDVLINNAGIGSYGPVLEASQEQWRSLFEINLFAAVFLIQLALPIMLEQKGGLIINIASIGGLMAHSDKVTPYVSSKHALVGFSRGLAKDLVHSGVTVKAVCPHLTSTDFFANSPDSGDLAEDVERFRKYMDTPQDVAAGVVAGLDEEGIILFPTQMPAKAYAKERDI